MLVSGCQDYLIAEGSTKATFNPDKGIVEVTSKYYYSQDGAKFIDLLPVSSEEAAQHGLRYQYVLSGDPASVCTVKVCTAACP